MKAPCKDCPERSPFCHASCEKYIAYDQYRKELREKMLKAKTTQNDYYDTIRRKK